ncbi:TetR/AcrR family transcriptional regulator [Paenibacillus nasutitermitis]|uniref:HTH tetR-type domain-containing protein n=1 Tax=Paenibacillus nasutitermitis TaxID=1652958 RepID=A0A916ZDU1_9BACL|nr:TetR/AcrR family transcriptional regulator [Paenibacillus nasutitermitis]GGD88486.1 hypothetical protein GCM10010911_53770 [Paenibacillus nasutitermitis]
MKREKGRQIEHVHDERREQIKRAALTVFARQGIDGTKMSMIAEEAGISQGLSYRYFSSKEEIFTELVREAMEESQKAIEEVQNLPGTPAELMRTFTKKMLDASHKPYFLLLQHAQKSEGVPESAKRIMEQYNPKDTIDRLIPIFIKGQQIGEFSEGDPYRLLFLYFTVIIGLMLQDVPMDEGYWLQEVDQLMKIITV